MDAANRGFLRWADRSLVAVAMAALALILEWLFTRSVRRAAKAGPASRSRR